MYLKKHFSFRDAVARTAFILKVRGKVKMGHVKLNYDFQGENETFSLKKAQ